MRNLLSSLLVVVLAFALTGAVAADERQPSVLPLESSVPTRINLGPSEGYVSCQVGNLNPAAWAIYSFLSPPEDYKLVFDPMATCTVCPYGFKVTMVHVYVATTAACQVALSVNVERAVPQSPDCYAPGPVLCSTGVFQVNLPQSGLWDIAIPVAPADCPGCACLPIGPKYLLSAHFESMTCDWANIGLVTDAGPATLCRNWNNYGPGWYDLVAAFPSWPGQLKFFADADCCNPPTPVAGSTWGSIKCLYR